MHPYHYVNKWRRFIFIFKNKNSPLVCSVIHMELKRKSIFNYWALEHLWILLYTGHFPLEQYSRIIQTFNLTTPRENPWGKGHAQCHVQLLMSNNLNHKNMFDVFSKLSCRKSSQIWFGWASYEGSLLPRMSSHNLKSFITSSGNAEYSRQSIIRF